MADHKKKLDEVTGDKQPQQMPHKHDEFPRVPHNGEKGVEHPTAPATQQPDPLEAAKVNDDPDAPIHSVIRPPAGEPVSEKQKFEALKAKGKHKDAPPPEPVQPAAPKMFKVLKDITISRGPQQLRFKEGRLVGESTHGTGCIEDFRNAGMALEEVKEEK